MVMVKVTAVMHPRLHLPSKRDVLFFDHIAVISLERTLFDLDASTAADLEWLTGKGIVTSTLMTPQAIARVDSDLLDQAVANAIASGLLSLAIARPKQAGTLFAYENILACTAGFEGLPSARASAAAAIAYAELAAVVPTLNSSSDASSIVDKALAVTRDLGVRLHAQVIRSMEQTDVTAILPTSSSFTSNATDGRAAAVNVVLDALPVPDDETPWEEVLEFREDEDASRALRSLRRWLNTIVKDNYSPLELQQELEYLVDQYRHYMRVHRMKVTRGRLEAFLVTTADIAQNLATFSLSDAVKCFFSARDHKIKLLEAELDAPGRDVANIVKSRDRFDRPGA